MDPDSSVVGTIGVLTIGTRGPNGPGEVLLKVGGGSESFLAWSDEPLSRGSMVLVVEARGARTLAVVGWSGSTATRSDASNEGF
jgi:hypothetical protein